MSVIGEGVGDGERELYMCHQPCPAESHNARVTKTLAFFCVCVRDQAQLDAASVSSIQVVGVVEALIQCTDTLFPGGDVVSSYHL